METASLLYRLGRRSGLGDDLETSATVEERDEPLAHHLMVIDHEQGQGRRPFGRCGHSVTPLAVRSCSGRTRTSVPCSGVLLMPIIAPDIAGARPHVA